MIQRIKYILMILLFLIPLHMQARTLYISILDTNNIQSFNKYFDKIKFKINDKFIILDAQTSQYIFEKKLVGADIVRIFNQKGQFHKSFDKSFKGYLREKNKKFDGKKEVFSLTKQKNDFARELKTVSSFIQVYKDNYKDIVVMFFGDSYIHNAYNNNFNLGIPSDGFINSNDSEFNTFDEIDASNVKFAIFYDVEPYSTRNKMFRFYRKLIKKKFNAELDSFNKNATFDADKNPEYTDKPFFPKLVKVIREPNKDDCLENDKITKNSIPELAKVKIEIVNECRKNTILSFSHNGEIRQVEVDNDGRGVTTFKLMVGDNQIKYKNLNSKWVDIVNEETPARQDGVTITLDAATSTVVIEGRNPLRENGSQFEILYENTGSLIYPKIEDGIFRKVVPIKIGDNVFSWKDMDGKKHSKTIVFDPKCTDKVDFEKEYAEENAIVQLTLENSCREDGSMVNFIYNDINYLAIIKDGKTAIDIILNNDINEVFWVDFDRNKQKLATIKIRNFEDLIRFMISFKDNVIVAMNVYETNIELDATKPIVGIDYNNTATFQEGHLHVASKKSAKGDILISMVPDVNNYLKDQYIDTYRQVYVTRKSKQGKGSLYFYVDYFSRHGLYSGKPPLCGKRSLGGVVVDYEILSDGSSQRGQKFLNPSHCTNSRHDKEDEEIILIKKVEIK